MACAKTTGAASERGTQRAFKACLALQELRDRPNSLALEAGMLAKKTVVNLISPGAFATQA
jgi:hypothetical protein